MVKAGQWSGRAEGAWLDRDYFYMVFSGMSTPHAQGAPGSGSRESGTGRKACNSIHPALEKKGGGQRPLALFRGSRNDTAEFNLERHPVPHQDPAFKEPGRAQILH